MHRRDSHAGGRVPIVVAFAAVAILIMTSAVLVAVHDTDGEPVVSGIAVDGLTYDINVKKHTATVTGLEDGYRPASLTIPGTVTYDNETYRVTAVGDNAFDYYHTEHQFTGTLTFGSPEDPSNIVTIGNSAFAICKFTGSLTIPPSVVTIKNNAFYNDIFTGDLTIPSGVTAIGDGAFIDCRFIGTLTICGNPHLDYGGPQIGKSAFEQTTFTAVNIFGGDLSNADIFRKDGGRTINSIFIADGVSAEYVAFPWDFYEKEGDTEPLEMNEIQNKYFEINDDRTKMIKVEDRYAVRFDTQGGNYILPVAANGEITLPSAGKVTKEGYTLLGWDKDGSVTDPEYEPGGTLNVTESTMLYAIWGGTVTFNPMGGTVDPTTIKGKGETELPTPTSTSPLTFRGWYDGSATYSGTYDVTKDVTLYAVWGEPAPGEKHVLSFDLDGGNGSFPIVKTEAGTYTLPADAPTKTGYTFIGWKCGGETYQAGEPVDVSTDMAFKAEWAADEYTITYRTDGSVYKTQSYDFGEEVTAPADPAKTGFIFKGWNPTVPATMPAEDITVNAMWEVKQHTMTFRVDGGVYVTAKYDYGAAITPPADPAKTGHAFKGWNPAVPAIMPDGDVTVDAKWTVNQYTITFDTDGGSTIDPIVQDYGTAVAKPANPTKQGYVFVAWDRPVPDTMPAENMTINAIWKVETGAEYVIIFEMEGGFGSFSTMRAAEGADVTLPEDEPVRTGYEFGGWSCNSAIYNPGDTIEGISSDMTLKALWTPVEYAVVFHGEDATDTQKMTYDVAAALKPNAFEKEGFDFKGWSFVKDSKAIAFEDEQKVKNLPFDDNKECHLYAVWGPKMDTGSGEVKKGSDLSVSVDSDAASGGIGAVTFTDGYGNESKVPKEQYEVSAMNGGITKITVLGSYTDTLSPGGYSLGMHIRNGYVSEGTVEITDPRPDPPVPPEPTPTYYEVSYDIAGGSELGPGTMLYKKGDTAEVASYNGHKDGYYFDGWSCGGKTYKAGDEFVVSGNMRFTAIWIPNSNPVPEPSNDNTGMIVGITVGIIATVALIGGAVYFIKKR